MAKDRDDLLQNEPEEELEDALAEELEDEVEEELDEALEDASDELEEIEDELEDELDDELDGEFDEDDLEDALGVDVELAEEPEQAPITRTRRSSDKKKGKSTKKSFQRLMHGNERRNVWLLILMTLLAIGSIFLFVPPSQTINQGLDIQGGLSVVLTAKTADGGVPSDDEMEASRSIIENRVNALGATEATVQLQGDDQILVQIPGLSDTQEALAAIGRTGKLTFARLDSFTDSEVIQKIQSGAYGSNQTVTDDFGNTFQTDETVDLIVPEGTYTPLITGSNISNVTVGNASEGSAYYSVNLRLDSEGTKAFADATTALAPTHGQIVIILDDVVQSAPSVQSEILTGEVSITGNYSSAEAKALKTVLESGSLPVSFEYAQSQVVGPTLGQDALRGGVLVALLGLALVMIYLLFFYRGLGIITAAAMAVFAILYLGILALLSRLGQFSLSLAGIAGIVLTIGMAADSSVLTLERFREEIRMGRSIRSASITGVHHAIMTSIDADLVSLVSGLTLFFLASASVKGFGLTLALGIMCDIIMMVIFKAPLIRLLAPRAIEKNPGFWNVADSLEVAELEKRGEDASGVKGRFIHKDINFMGFKKYFLMAAGAAMVICFAVFAFRGLSFGIEFVGGTSITFHGTGDVTTEQLREAFDDADEPNAVIQTTTTGGEEGFLVRTTTMDAETAAAHARQVADQFGWTTENFEVTTIGPDWGAGVVKSSLIAFLVSIVLIIIYIAIRFEWRMGFMAVVALLHDLILVIGIYALFGREITPNVVAALLTILGYSLYDTVVVFHRINDNMQADDTKCTFLTMANHSINQVFLRTINTTLTSLFPVLFMLLFGSETLKDFAFAMVIGLIAGSYSSIAIAVPLFSMWKTREPRYKKLEKKYGSDVKLFVMDRLPSATPALVAAGAGAGQVTLAGQGAGASKASKQSRKPNKPKGSGGTQGNKRVKRPVKPKK